MDKIEPRKVVINQVGSPLAKYAPNDIPSNEIPTSMNT